jgi:lipoprotein-releasing system ATP-binding protein
VLEAKQIVKVYPQGATTLEVLKGIDLQLTEGQALSIVGSSGAGKSTLLHILGTLDRPTSGSVFFKGQNVFELSDSQLAKFRNANMGFVFQFHHLLSEFTALDNMIMPGRLAGWSTKQMRERSDELFSFMGLSDRKKHYPSELSGGEQQRIAIARALFLRPALILADEPTGNLDAINSLKIQQLLFDLHQQMRVSLVVVTHDLSFAQKFPRQLRMTGGQWA